MRIGFTGTRAGMSDNQKNWFLYHVLQQGNETFSPNEFHHGDAVGSDADAHEMINELNKTIPFDIHIHPSNMEDQRAFCKGYYRLYEPQNPLVRNIEIVKACDLLIATPATSTRTPHSGTWHTIRRAQGLGVPVIIIPKVFRPVRVK